MNCTTLSKRTQGIRSTTLQTLAVLLIVSLSAPCLSAQSNEPRLFHQAHPAMGSEFVIDLYAPDEKTADEWMQLAFDEVDRIEELLSNYRPSSELSRINREAAEHAVTTDPETYQFLKTSMDWSRRSNGAFDMTVGPLMRAWGFFFNNGRIPPDKELADLRSHTGWQNVLLDDRIRSVSFKDHASMELDPGGIGKGYAVDRIVALFRQQHVSAALISAGSSSIYAIGAPPDSAGWRVNIPDPAHSGKVLTSIWLRDTSLSTSACTEKFFIKDGHRYCHILNPQTLRPVEDMLQTTIVSPSTTDTDALSTATFVMGPEAATKLLAPMNATSAVIVSGTSEKPRYYAVKWPQPLAQETTQK